ncbi:type III-B CRISPR-associated protein Cas10/Cmr2 [Neomoorella humiferrea]|uniref:CRISPR-associated protein n=1 Tax=Neomoorella humiferrea TaxID=676965 RepID=A0A2T0AWI1_9FIRM|nr:type III-B CRISPR-associated protein Cas10/Cmr2 [Moorella humiferrea]PRR75071.1 CRISPR-associated protein [Moorella humiferrea]
MNSLLIFTIGPVQSFIAQARKTQDLYAGSYILSHLCGTAARTAQDNYEAEIIYPDLHNGSLPNRLVALLPVGEKEELQEIGRQLESKVRDEFVQIGRQVVRSFGLPVTPALEAQLQDFLEIYWVGGNCEPSRYAERYRQMEAVLGAIKNTRIFSSGGERGRKCSITGEHNALFYRGGKKAYLEQAFRVPESVPKKYLAPGEALSGIGFMKRAAARYFCHCLGGNFDSDFPSTASIALAASLHLLPADIVESYKKIFAGEFDDQFFYQENLTPRRFALEGLSLEKLQQADALLKELYSEAKKRGIKFTKYYALLVMDGDNMGEWVAGKNLADQGQLPDFQRNLTRYLGAYAREAKAILQLPRGKLVYCGGDDVLGLINLNHLLSVLKDLRDKFPPLEKIANMSQQKTSSTSGGVCIAHYKAPLAEVIKFARKMEEVAKGVDGKDALAIGVLKHSGEICQTVFRWKYDNLEPLSLLHSLVVLLSTGKFSDTFIRNLSREFRSLIPPADESLAKKSGNIALKAAEEEMVAAEIKRLLQRSCQLQDPTEADKIVSELREKLFTLYLECGLVNFLSFLDIAAFLSREVQVISEVKD